MALSRRKSGIGMVSKRKTVGTWRLQRRPAEDESETGDPQEDESEHVNRKLIQSAPMRAGKPGEERKRGAGGEKQGSGAAVGGKELENAIAFEIQEPSSDDRDQDQMRSVIVCERVVRNATSGRRKSRQVAMIQPTKIRRAARENPARRILRMNCRPQ